MGPLEHAFLYLVAAVVAVPIAKRLGLGSVLGYLIAGVIIGPALGLVGSETEAIQHFAEFGVVMMLFLVGLELQPAMLWRMRGMLLGLGGLQVLVTMLVISGVSLALGLSWQASLAIGMTLALSSTAIVLQTLNEKGWMKSPAGQSAFSVLLFQDIAVIPMLALLPLLAIADPAVGEAAGHHGGALDGLPGWLRAITILGVIVGIIAAGRFLIRPIFRFIAAANLREIFTAAALLLVIGVALLMSAIGLSPALGTFLAGVVLSDSEYRHELEGDIDPFKGLLLGLFFITVGAAIDFELVVAHPGTILGLAAGIMAVKLLVLLGIARLFDVRGNARWLFALSLAQAGEFAFVLFGFAQTSGVIPAEETRILMLVVAVTMMLTPALFILYERVIAPRGVGRADQPADEIDEKGTAIVAGVGRFGIVVSRMLATNGHKVVVLDHDADLIELLRRVGIKTWYGDATRPDLLEAAGIAEAQLFVAALDDRERQVQLVEHVVENHPDCRVLARAQDHGHMFQLERAGAHHIEREVMESAITAGRTALIHPDHCQRSQWTRSGGLMRVGRGLVKAPTRAKPHEGAGKRALDFLSSMHMSKSSNQNPAVTCIGIVTLALATLLTSCSSSEQVNPALLEVWKASKVQVASRFEKALNRGFFVGKSPIVGSQDVSSAKFGTDQLGHKTLTVTFKPKASKKMQEALLGWQDFVVITLNGRVVESFKLHDPFIADRLSFLLPDPLAEGEREALEALGKK